MINLRQSEEQILAMDQTEEEADVTLYAEQCPARDLSQVGQSGDWSGLLLDEKVGTCKDVSVDRGHECIEEWRESHSPYLVLRR